MHSQLFIDINHYFLNYTYKKAIENKEYSLANWYEGFRSDHRSNEASTNYVNPNINNLFKDSIPKADTVYPDLEVPYSDQYKENLETIRNDNSDSKTYTIH